MMTLNAIYYFTHNFISWPMEKSHTMQHLIAGNKPAKRAKSSTVKT
jgi:hypothetical protein